MSTSERLNFHFDPDQVLQQAQNCNNVASHSASRLSHEVTQNIAFRSCNVMSLGHECLPQDASRTLDISRDTSGISAKFLTTAEIWWYVVQQMVVSIKLMTERTRPVEDMPKSMKMPHYVGNYRPPEPVSIADYPLKPLKTRKVNNPGGSDSPVYVHPTKTRVDSSKNKKNQKMKKKSTTISLGVMDTDGFERLFDSSVSGHHKKKKKQRRNFGSSDEDDDSDHYSSDEDSIRETYRGMEEDEDSEMGSGSDDETDSAFNKFKSASSGSYDSYTKDSEMVLHRGENSSIIASNNVDILRQSLRPADNGAQMDSDETVFAHIGPNIPPLSLYFEVVYEAHESDSVTFNECNKAQTYCNETLSGKSFDPSKPDTNFRSVSMSPAETLAAFESTIKLFEELKLSDPKTEEFVNGRVDQLKEIKKNIEETARMVGSLNPLGLGRIENQHNADPTMIDNMYATQMNNIFNSHRKVMGVSFWFVNKTRLDPNAFFKEKLWRNFDDTLSSTAAESSSFIRNTLRAPVTNKEKVVKQVAQNLNMFNRIWEDVNAPPAAGSSVVPAGSAGGTGGGGGGGESSTGMGRGKNKVAHSTLGRRVGYEFIGPNEAAYLHDLYIGKKIMTSPDFPSLISKWKQMGEDSPMNFNNWFSISNALRRANRGDENIDFRQSSSYYTAFKNNPSLPAFNGRIVYNLPDAYCPNGFQYLAFPIQDNVYEIDTSVVLEPLTRILNFTFPHCQLHKHHPVVTVCKDGFKNMGDQLNINLKPLHRMNYSARTNLDDENGGEINEEMAKTDIDTYMKYGLKPENITVFASKFNNFDMRNLSKFMTFDWNLFSSNRTFAEAPISTSNDFVRTVKKIWDTIEKSMEGLEIDQSKLIVLKRAVYLMHQSWALAWYERIRNPNYPNQDSLKAVYDCIKKEEIYDGATRPIICRITKHLDGMSDFLCTLIIAGAKIYKMNDPHTFAVVLECANNSSCWIFSGHIHLMLVGPGALSKSFILETIEAIRIGGDQGSGSQSKAGTGTAGMGAEYSTTVRMSRATAKAFESDARFKFDLSALMRHEFPVALLNGEDSGGKKDSRGKAAEKDGNDWFKEVSESGRSVTYVLEFDQQTKERKLRKVVNEMRCNFIGAINSAVDWPEPVKQRFLIIYMKIKCPDVNTMNEKQLSEAMTREDQTARLQKRNFTKILRCIQAYKTEMEILLAAGAFINVCETLGWVVIFYVNSFLSKHGAMSFHPRESRRYVKHARDLVIERWKVENFIHQGGRYYGQDFTIDKLKAADPFLTITTREIVTSLGILGEYTGVQGVDEFQKSLNFMWRSSLYSKLLACNISTWVDWPYREMLDPVSHKCKDIEEMFNLLEPSQKEKIGKMIFDRCDVLTVLFPLKIEHRERHQHMSDEASIVNEVANTTTPQPPAGTHKPPTFGRQQRPGSDRMVSSTNPDLFELDYIKFRGPVGEFLSLVRYQMDHVDNLDFKPPPKALDAVWEHLKDSTVFCRPVCYDSSNPFWPIKEDVTKPMLTFPIVKFQRTKDGAPTEIWIHNHFLLRNGLGKSLIKKALREMFNHKGQPPRQYIFGPGVGDSMDMIHLGCGYKSDTADDQIDMNPATNPSAFVELMIPHFEDVTSLESILLKGMCIYSGVPQNKQDEIINSLNGKFSDNWTSTGNSDLVGITCSLDEAAMKWRKTQIFDNGQDHMLSKPFMEYCMEFLNSCSQTSEEDYDPNKFMVPDSDRMEKFKREFKEILKQSLEDNEVIIKKSHEEFLRKKVPDFLNQSRGYDDDNENVVMEEDEYVGCKWADLDTYKNMESAVPNSSEGDPYELEEKGVTHRIVDFDSIEKMGTKTNDSTKNKENQEPAKPAEKKKKRGPSEIRSYQKVTAKLDGEFRQVLVGFYGTEEEAKMGYVGDNEDSKQLNGKLDGTGTIYDKANQNSEYAMDFDDIGELVPEYKDLEAERRSHLEHNKIFPPSFCHPRRLLPEDLIDNFMYPWWEFLVPYSLFDRRYPVSILNPKYVPYWVELGMDIRTFSRYWGLEEVMKDFSRRRCEGMNITWCLEDHDKNMTYPKFLIDRYNKRRNIKRQFITNGRFVGKKIVTEMAQFTPINTIVDRDRMKKMSSLTSSSLTEVSSLFAPGTPLLGGKSRCFVAPSSEVADTPPYDSSGRRLFSTEKYVYAGAKRRRSEDDEDDGERNIFEPPPPSNPFEASDSESETDASYMEKIKKKNEESDRKWESEMEAAAEPKIQNKKLVAAIQKKKKKKQNPKKKKKLGKKKKVSSDEDSDDEFAFDEEGTDITNMMNNIIIDDNL